MTIKTVKVIEIETVKGGKADRIVLHYVGTDGTTWKIGALAAKLDTTSRTALLAAKPGDSITIEMIKDGAYWNLTRVGSDGVPLVASSAPATRAQGSLQPSATTWNKPTTKSSGYDSLGNQIGNCITNAVNSLGEGRSAAEYKTRAIELLQMGDEIRASAESGGLKAPTTVLNDTTQQQTADSIDADIGF